MVSQGKSGGHMYVPPSGMVRNSGPDFDQTLDQPVDGAFHFFTPDLELADHMQEVVGQNPHFEPPQDPGPKL